VVRRCGILPLAAEGHSTLLPVPRPSWSSLSSYSGPSRNVRLATRASAHPHYLGCHTWGAGWWWRRRRICARGFADCCVGCDQSAVLRLWDGLTGQLQLRLDVTATGTPTCLQVLAGPHTVLCKNHSESLVVPRVPQTPPRSTHRCRCTHTAHHLMPYHWFRWLPVHGRAPGPACDPFQTHGTARKILTLAAAGKTEHRIGHLVHLSQSAVSRVLHPSLPPNRACVRPRKHFRAGNKALVQHVKRGQTEPGD